MMLNSPSRGFAVRRIDRTIARVSATSTALIVFLQAIPNALSEAEYLTPIGLWLGIAMVGSLIVAQVIGAWLGQNIVWLYFLFHTATFIGILTWPLVVRPEAHFPSGMQPWYWWLLAVATFHAFASLRITLAVISSLLLNIAWMLLSTTETFGNRPLAISLQDTLLAFFFGTVMGLLLLVLRQQTAKVDIGMEQRAETSASSARIRAAENERARMNALVHDAVLTTLIIGANADSPQERQRAAASAKHALNRLLYDVSEVAPIEISVSAFFDSVARAASEVAPDLELVVEQNQELRIPGSVAAAFTQATIQAITNSVQHAGTVKSRQLRLSSTSTRFKIVVVDDGRGFRESRIPKHRLGVRLSIRERISAVGGRVAIQSQPGQGTTITMIWALGDAHQSESLQSEVQP